VEIVIGDARLKLAAAADGQFDLLIVDAFSSDAVPAHLLTREALAMYMDKLRSDGIVAFHISNRFMDLATVLSAIAADFDLTGAVGTRDPGSAGLSRMHMGSRWVVLARDHGKLANLLTVKDWVALERVPPSRLWTDDYTDVLSAIRWF
jgi:spermidine synthase